MRRSGFKGLVAAGLVATSMAASTSVVSASDIFLKLGDIKGESTDSKHKEWIDVLSWSWGMSSGTGRVKGGRLAPQCIQDLTLTKLVDSSSPKIIMAGVLGEIQKEATLTLRKAGGDQQEYLTIKMTDVLVTSYQTGGAGGSDAMLTDQVVLNFSSIRGEYRPQDETGKLGTPVVFEINSTCPSDPSNRQ